MVREIEARSGREERKAEEKMGEERVRRPTKDAMADGRTQLMDVPEIF